MTTNQNLEAGIGKRMPLHHPEVPVVLLWSGESGCTTTARTPSAPPEGAPRPRGLAVPVSEQFYSDETTDAAPAIYAEDFEKLGYPKYVP